MDSFLSADGGAATGGNARLLPSAAREAGDVAAQLAVHLDRLGPVPYRDGTGRLTSEIAAAGLTGRGGVSFPAHRKMQAVAAQPGRAVVVGNGAEGEPASEKDKALLRQAPHLVLDGLQLAAEAVAATRALLYVSRGTDLKERLAAQITQRSARGLDRVRVELFAGPPRFLAGEETGLASVISGGAALPSFTPPRVSQRGVDRLPTLVLNVETLAHVALIAHHGPGWFRSAGTAEEPGTMLCTLRTADGLVKVAEAELGTPIPDLLDLAGAEAVLVGGYHGAWVAASQAAGLALSNASLRPASGSVGAGLLAVLPAGRCGLAETARIARYLALESAGQCGPCLNGMTRMAAELRRLAQPGAPDEVLANLGQWAGLTLGRGACHLPDGAVRMIGTALRTFAREIRLHQQGSCSAGADVPFLPIPATPVTESDWH
jgi:NADH:ubiquinone oxidoreductase subunit F (NADH-binding)